jgi:phage gp36-like protein
MTFATEANLRAFFGDREINLLADRDGDGQVDPGVLDAMLGAADAEIISLIGQRVDPANPPVRLVQLACDIGRYRLYGSNPPDDVRSRYTDAVKFLQAVSAGTATLDGGAAAPTDVQVPPKPAAYQGDARLFRRGL